MATSISDVNTVCNQIRNIVQTSGLHFIINQTPWFSYITVRRKFLNPGAYNVKVNSPPTVIMTDSMKEKNEELEHKLAGIGF